MRQACSLSRISIGCYRYRSRRSPDHEIIDRLPKLANWKPRWAFGLMFDWLRMKGFSWNHKRVRRVYRELELNLRIKPRKRLPSRDPTPLVVPEEPGVSWSLDFIKPGTPTQNAYIERCNRTFRNEILDLHLFEDREDAQMKATTFMWDDSRERSHEALGKTTPHQFRLNHQAGASAKGLAQKGRASPLADAPHPPRNMGTKTTAESLL
jgi:hypothetical protein